MMNETVLLKSSGDFETSTESWIVALKPEIMTAWETYLKHSYIAVSHYFRSEMAVIVFPIVEPPEENDGLVFKDVYIVSPDILPSYLGGVFFINQKFIEVVIPEGKLLKSKLLNLMGVWDRKYLKEKWEEHKVLFIGVCAPNGSGVANESDSEEESPKV